MSVFNPICRRLRGWCHGYIFVTVLSSHARDSFPQKGLATFAVLFNWCVRWFMQSARFPIRSSHVHTYTHSHTLEWASLEITLPFGKIRSRTWHTCVAMCSDEIR